MDDQRDDGPPRYRDQPDVGASAKRREEQDREVRVAARGDEAEIAVEFLPDMDIHAEVLDEQSLDYALEHIARDDGDHDPDEGLRSEEHTSELQSLMRTSYAVFCL